MSALLETKGLCAHYGDFQALFGIDLHVARGEVVSVIGANGAGKSTFLRSLAGLQPVKPDMIVFDGAAIGGMPAYDVVRKGIALVPEGRRLFPSLSVEDNLRLGANPGRQGAWDLQRVYQLFPVLAERRRQPATTLSGGQQQMVAIGRALLSNPSLLLCDEISLGLAPTVIKDIYAALPGIVASGMAVMVVEQDIGQATRVADRIYCFQEGRVSLSGRPGEFSRDQISAAYFGAAGVH